MATNQERPTGARELLGVARDQLRRRLPGDWLVDVRTTERGDRVGGGRLVIVPPGDTALELDVEAKRSVVGRDVDAFAARRPTNSVATSLLVSSYLAAPVRDRLDDFGLNYVDATGNIRVSASQPALFVRDVGADRDPWRGPGRPRANLRGRPAALVVRALADFTPPYSVAKLVALSGASTGATYRVVDYLVEEGLIEQDPGSRTIADVAWDRMLYAWTRDYVFAETNAPQRFLAPRGIEDALDRLADLDSVSDPQSRYAVTGSVAAREWSSIAPARALTVYADNPQRFASATGLRQVDTGANVLVARPKYEGLPFLRTQKHGEVVITGPSQTFVDLATGPGRNPSEADELLGWMRRNPAEWRRRA